MENPAIKRQSFSKNQDVNTIPDLLSLQVYSWDDFLQEDILPEKRENKGLEAVFKNIFPVEDNHKNYILEYKHYYLGLPKYKVKECLERRISYSLPLKIRFGLAIEHTKHEKSTETVVDLLGKIGGVL